MADIKQIEVSGTKYNIAGAAIVLEDNGTTDVSEIKVKTSQINSLEAGQLFLLKWPVSYGNYDYVENSSNIIITLSNGTQLTKKFILQSTVMDYIELNTVYLITYNGNVFIQISDNGCFKYNVSKIYNGDVGSTRIKLASDGIMFNTPGSGNNHGFYKFKANCTKISGGTYGSSGRSCVYIDYNNNTPIMSFRSSNADTEMQFTGTKVLGSRELYLGTKVSSNSFIRIENGCIKMHLTKDDDNNEYPFYKFGETRFALNRPIHINDPVSETGANGGVQMEYNSSDDSLDIIFE